MLQAWMHDEMTVRYYVEMPNNQYLSIGYGETMMGVDMVVWIANGLSSTCLDLWSTTHATPNIDA